jgi:hypothetical protein
MENNVLFVILLIALFLLLIAMVAPLVHILWRFRSAQNALDALHLKIPQEAVGEIRTRVWISNVQQRRRFFKITPSNEFGILVLTPERISLHSINKKGEQSIRQFDRGKLRTEWIGNKLMRDSNLHWFAILDGSSRILISAYTGINAMPSRSQTAELYRNIVGQHEQFEGTKEFALEKNPASLSALVIIFLLFIYAIADGLFLNPLEIVGYKIEFLPLLFFLALLTVSVILFYKKLIKFSVPARETLFLTMLFFFVLSISGVTIVKRIDTSTAVEPMQNYDYKANEKDVLEPLQEGLPKLPLKTKNEYWKQFEDDHIFQFPLQKGGFGFWQFDGRELDKDIEAFYANKSEDKNNEQPESYEQ